MFFIGDVHGRFKQYRRFVKTMELDSSLQVGDMGIFRIPERHKISSLDPAKHKFFRGNHDNPAACRMSPNYLGDYGYMERLDMFWVAGGYSIDHMYRIPGQSWWHDEEIPTWTLNEILGQYKEMAPRIMVTHEAPTIFKDICLTNRIKMDINSRTELALQAMWEAHQPEIWICGHHHRRVTWESKGTRFECLDEFIHGKIEDCYLEIPDLSW